MTVPVLQIIWLLCPGLLSNFLHSGGPIFPPVSPDSSVSLSARPVGSSTNTHTISPAGWHEGVVSTYHEGRLSISVEHDDGCIGAFPGGLSTDDAHW